MGREGWLVFVVVMVVALISECVASGVLFEGKLSLDNTKKTPERSQADLEAEEEAMFQKWMGEMELQKRENWGNVANAIREKKGQVYLPHNVPKAAIDWFDALLVIDLTTGPTHNFLKTRLPAIISSINTQIHEDFLPLWGVGGTLLYDSFLQGKVVEYLPSLKLNTTAQGIVFDDDQAFALGPYLEAIKTKYDWSHSAIVYIIPPTGQNPHHLLQPDPNHHKMVPYALVMADAPENKEKDFTITFSHEVLELLADPFAEAFVHRPNTTEAWMLEVCDPIEDDSFSYTIGDVAVSDFITPNFYDPDFRGGAVDFRGHLKNSYTILKNGYASFYSPESEEVNQWTWFPVRGETSPTLHSAPKDAAEASARGVWWEEDQDKDGDDDHHDVAQRALERKLTRGLNHNRHANWQASASLARKTCV